MDIATRTLLRNQVLIMEIMAVTSGATMADKKKLLEQIETTKLIINHSV